MTAVMAAVLIVYFGYRAWTDPSDRAASFTVSLTVLGLTVYYLASAHKRRVVIAHGHTLELTADAIVLRDGPTERRIPYHGIEKMTVRKPLVGERWLSLKVRGLEPERLYGYQDMDRLVSSLASRLPREIVSGQVPSA